MNKKILFFDIDGTLITKDTFQVPESTKVALDCAKEKGHLLYVNTGRPISIVNKTIKNLGFHGYVCGCGTYIQSQGEVLLSHSIEATECRRIIELLRSCRIDAVLEGHKDLYFDLHDGLTAKMRQMKEFFTSHGVGIRHNWDHEGLTFDKFYCIQCEDSDWERFVAEMESGYDIIDRGEQSAEIIPRGHSKATGIEFLLRHHGLSLEDCFAFGDSSNDLPMLSYVPNSIAMGESDQIVYDVASFITKDIEEDGIAHAMGHFGII